MYCIGQGIWGRIRFVDGAEPRYDRPYLIVKIDGQRIGVLNVSTVAGKAHKAADYSNYTLTQFHPPFTRASFVKLDSLTIVTEDFVNNNCRLLDNGNILNAEELNYILSQI